MTTPTVSTPYVETDCTFPHNGQEFTSGGAVITPDYIVAYPSDNNILTDWHGIVIGTWKTVASWSVESYIGSRMHQIEARVNGIVYTGRGFGKGMSYKGKRKARQL